MSFGNPTSANIVKSSAAVSQLISTPANNILVFTQKLAAPYDPSPRAESCSPLSLTNPPIGSQFTVNNTPFLSFFFHARGGNPMPNSSTTTPFRRATIACPSSCSTTSNTSTNSPSKIPSINVILLSQPPISPSILLKDIVNILGAHVWPIFIDKMQLAIRTAP